MRDILQIIRVLPLLLILISHACGATMHFPTNKLVRHLCDAGASTQTVDSSVPVSVQFPPVMYSLNGNTTIFTIDPDTGIITALMTLDTAARSKFILQKQVTDSHGSKSVMDIYVYIIKSRLAVKQCPKLQQLCVREIAAIGEEVGQLECESYVPNLFEKDRTTINTTGDYIPFNITSTGIVMVTSPLHFRNSIEDIIIFNATIQHFTNNASHGDCRVTQTQLIMRVTVKKAECPSNWTYVTQSNKILSYPPLLSLSSVSTERCMETCSAFNSTPCNSFVYNLVRKSCDLYNETDVTIPKLVQGRLGFFLYRKHCQTEMLSKYSLRQLNMQIRTLPLLNTSVSKQLLCSLLSIIMEINMTHSDRIFTADILYTVVTNTTFNNSTNSMTAKYLKAVCQLVDHFIEHQIAGISQDVQKVLYQLILTFDTLVESLTSGLTSVHGNIEVKTNHTHVRTQHMSSGAISQRVDLVASGDVSRVVFPDELNGTLDNQHLLLVTGAITIPDKKLTLETVAAQDKNIDRHMTLSGHMVSVSVRPYFRSMFVTPLQLDIFNPVTGDQVDRVCVFLQMQGDSHHWRDTGCQMVAYNTTHVRCQCNHLTNFAVLMQIKEFKLSKVHSATLEVVTVIGCCISIVSLSTTVLTILWLRLQSDRYVLLMNLSVAIVLAQVVFLTGIDATQSKVVCRFVAILLHYLYLAVFTLMLAEGIYLYQKLYRAFTTDTSLTMFLLLGWGAPFIVVAISLLTDTEGYGTDKHCWLSTEGAIWAFVGPALTIISINTAILVIIVQTFLGIKINERKTDMEKFKSSVRVTVVLLPLLGVTWMFGVVAVNSSTVIFQYAFAILNSLQGLFIFLFHIVFNEEVRSSCNRYRARVGTLAYTLEQAPDKQGPDPTPQVRGHRQGPGSAVQGTGHKQGVLYRKITPVPQSL